jgi:hypothetical protein
MEHYEHLERHLCHREEQDRHVEAAGIEAAAVAAHIRTADAAADGSMEGGQVEVVEEGSCTAECQPSGGRGCLDVDVATHWDFEERTSEGQCIEPRLLF